MMNILAQLLCSQIRGEIFRILFGLRNEEIHLRELARQTGFSLAAVRQDLGKLTKLGLVTSRKDGNRLNYQANRGHPLFGDLHRIVLKTAGLVETLQAQLRTPKIRIAFIFGSIAGGRETASSDVDLMIIGKAGLREISTLLQGQSEILGREINPHVLSPEEFTRKREHQDHFLASVLASSKLFLIGSPNDLAELA